MRHHRGRVPLAPKKVRPKLPFFDAGNQAKGFIAVGNVAQGVFAFGNVAIGSVFAMGNVAVGLFAVGNVAVSPLLAIGATVAAGGVIARAGVVSFGAASTHWLASMGIHIGSMIDLPLPLGLLVAPVVWTVVGKALAPERSMFRTNERLQRVEKQGNANRLSGQILEIRETGTDAIYVVDAGADVPFEIHGHTGLARKGDDVIVTAETERTESASGGDYRSPATITERLVATSVRIIPPKGEPDENHVLAVWYSRSFVIALLAIPLALVLLALR